MVSYFYGELRKMKNIRKISVLLIVGLILSMPFSISFATAQGEILLQENFDNVSNGGLPTGWSKFDNSYNGAISVTDGALYIDGRSSDYTMTSVAAPSSLLTTGDYTISFDFTITSSNNDTRWAGFVFRMKNSSEYFQMCVRKNPTNNGVEISERLANATWSVKKTATFSESIDAAKTYHARITTLGNKAFFSINDKTILSYTLPEGFLSGGIGFQCVGSILKVDNLVVSKTTELPEDLSMLKNTYIVNTGIALPPTVVANVKESGDFDAFNTDKTPASAVLNLDSSLNVLSEDGVIISDLNSALTKLGSKIIPAFYIKDYIAADKLIVFINDIGLKDGFVISDNQSLVKRVREKCKLIRGVIDFSFTGNLSETNKKDIRDITNSNLAKIAILPNKYATREVIDYLQKRVITVWLKDTDNKTDIYSGILKGSNGLVTEDFGLAIDSLEMFEDSTLVRKPYVVAHRGMPSVEQENTIKGAKAAVAAGADAVENDIYLTTDNKIVVIHDSTLDRTTNGTGDVESYSSEQLKAFGVNNVYSKAVEPIPFLEDYFEEFKDTGIMLFIEVKSSKPELITHLKAMIDQYEISDQIVFISFNASMLTLCRQQMPEISAGYLKNVTGIEALDAVENMITISGENNFTIHPDYKSVNYDRINAAKDRGIGVYPWTYRDAQVFNTDYKNGIYGLTTDYSDFASNYVYELKPLDNYMLYNTKLKAKTFEAEAVSKSNTRTVTCEVIQIDGDATLIKEADAYYTSKKGSITVVLRYLSEDLNYYIYTQPIKIAVAGENTSNTVKVGGCGTANKVGLYSIILFAVLASASLIIKKKV